MKKTLREMTDEEIIKKAIKHNKRRNISSAMKWVSFAAHTVALMIAPEAASVPILISNLSCINMFGIMQLVNSDDLNKCKKVLESRGSLYKLTEIIEKDNVQENEVGRRVSQVGKDEIYNEVGDVFPEFADNSSYSYRKSDLNSKTNNPIERG